MIMDSLDEYLETVAGYVFDNDKLVTYKWLSKELEVHVNIAKQILWAFWQRYKEEKSFECAFLLMGVLHDGGMRVEVLKEKDLSKGKEKFAKIVSEHVYSLQKVLPEVQMLGLAENGSIKHSAIKCLECNERNDEEMHILRWGAVSTEVQPITQKKVESPPTPTNETIQKSREKKSSGTKKSTQKKGFDNLFGKTDTKQKSPSSTSSSTEKMEENVSNLIKPKTTLKSPKKLAKKTGLDMFLQQGKNAGKVTNSAPSEIKESTNSMTKENTEKKITNSMTKENTEKKITNSMTKENTEKKITNSMTKENTEKKITLESNDKQKKNKSNTRGKKRNRSKEGTAAVKKRKRITIESDSSDTELSDEEKEEDEELPSPEKIPPVRARSPSPPKVKLEGGKRKVLKMVDKTFEEDGYLVTKKVHVYESCSEDEPEVTEVKKSVAPELHPEKKEKKTNTKQTNLMNYFKKS